MKSEADSTRDELYKMLGIEALDCNKKVCFEFCDPELSEPAVLEAIKRWPHLNNLRLLDSDKYKSENVLIDKRISGTLRRAVNHNGVAVLCLHGHARGAMLGKEMAEYCAVPLASRGFVTLAVDLMGFGNRRNREFDDMELACGGQTLFLEERIAFSRFLTQGKTLLGAQLEELISCVTFLKSLEGINKVVVMGHSMGGIYSFWLGALDKRIDVTVCLAGMLCYEAFANSDNAKYHGVYSLVPGISGKYDSGDILSLIAPRAFYGIHGENDLGFPVENIRRNSDKARNIYCEFGKENLFKSELISGDHGEMLTEKYLNPVFDFLESFI